MTLVSAADRREVISPTPQAPATAWWLLPLLFAYLFAVRTHNISEHFWLLGDQIRDWRVALGPWNDLPLVGTPSTAGGTTLGPIFYWVLWVIRVIVGPFTDNLPHAGGIGLSALHSAADAFLFYALAQRLGSVVLALAIVLLEATSPYDMALTATIWNPVLATTLSKAAIGMVLLSRGWSIGRTALVVALGWLGLQAHMGAVPVALAAIGWTVLQPLLEGWPRRALVSGCVAIAVVALLQVPYASAHWHRTGPPERSRIRDSMVYSLQHPGELRPLESARALGRVMNDLLWAPFPLPRSGVLLTFGALLGLLLCRRDTALVAMAIGPLVLAVAVFSLWRGRLGEHYWYLSLITCAALSQLMFVSRLHPARLRATLAALALVAIVLMQPARCRAAWQIHRLPEYGAVVRASRQIARQAPEVRAIVAPFLPRTSNAVFLYEILGGHISRDAPLVAVIDRQGMVTYVEQ